MTEVEAVPGDETVAIPVDPWIAYLAAARRLDVVRRGAAATAVEQAHAVQAARDELTGLRDRLAPQRNRLVQQFGVPETELTPTPAELAAATQMVAGGPVAVLAALRQARATADLADAATESGAPVAVGGGTASPWLRNLLVYGPFAAATLVVQVVLYLVAESDSLLGYGLLCGLAMPVAAFGLGWLMIGLVFRGGSGGRVDRTPVVGAVVCVAPVVLACLGIGLLQLIR
jgi:hypothetical protein